MMLVWRKNILAVEKASAKALRQALPGVCEEQLGGQGVCSKVSKWERIEDEWGRGWGPGYAGPRGSGKDVRF